MMSIQDLVPWMSKNRHDLSPRGNASPLVSLQQEMNRIFDDFFDLAPFRGEGGNVLAPKVDVSETDTEIHIAAELPGISEKDVDVTLVDGALIIRGEKKSETEDKQKNYHRVERAYGTFQRSVPLPTEVEAGKVDATFQNGVLSVVLPKVQPAKAAGRKITVRRAT